MSEKYYYALDWHKSHPNHFFSGNFKHGFELVLGGVLSKVVYNQKECLFIEAVYLHGNARQVIKAFNKQVLVIGEPFWFCLNSFTLMQLNESVIKALDGNKKVHIVFRHQRKYPVLIESFKILESEDELKVLVDSKRNVVLAK